MSIQSTFNVLSKTTLNLKQQRVMSNEHDESRHLHVNKVSKNS